MELARPVREPSQVPQGGRAGKQGLKGVPDHPGSPKGQAENLGRVGVAGRCRAAQKGPGPMGRVPQQCALDELRFPSNSTSFSLSVSLVKNLSVRVLYGCQLLPGRNVPLTPSSAGRSPGPDPSEFPLTLSLSDLGAPWFGASAGYYPPCSAGLGVNSSVGRSGPLEWTQQGRRERSCVVCGSQVWGPGGSEQTSPFSATEPSGAESEQVGARASSTGPYMSPKTLGECSREMGRPLSCLCRRDKGHPGPSHHRPPHPGLRSPVPSHIPAGLLP